MDEVILDEEGNRIVNETAIEENTEKSDEEIENYNESNTENEE